MATDPVRDLAARLSSSLVVHDGLIPLPDRQSVGALCHSLLTVLFPGCFAPKDGADTYQHLMALQAQLIDLAGRA